MKAYIRLTACTALFLSASGCKLITGLGGESTTSTRNSSTLKSAMSGVGGSLKLDEPAIPAASTIQIFVLNDALCQQLIADPNFSAISGIPASALSTFDVIQAGSFFANIWTFRPLWLNHPTTSADDKTSYDPTLVSQIRAPGPNACVVNGASLPYQPGSQATISGIADGQYDVTTEIDDANFKPLYIGSGSVQISNGEVAPVSITLTPAVVSSDGGIGVSKPIPNASEVTISSTNNSGVVGTCIEIHLEAHTNGGTKAPFDVDQNISFTSTSNTGQFYSDNACTTQITSRTLNAGKIEDSVFFKDITTGTPTLTASSTTDTTITPSTTSLSIGQTTVSEPRHLVFPAIALSDSAGKCTVVNVQMQNSTGAPTSERSPQIISTTSTSATGKFYNDSACSTVVTSISIPAGASEASIFYKDPTAGMPSLTAADSTDNSIASATEIITLTATPTPPLVPPPTPVPPFIGPINQCWAAGGPGQAAYALANKVTAYNCARHIATKNHACAAAARFGEIDCARAASMRKLTPVQCSCPGGKNGGAQWLKTPSKL